VVEAFVFVQVEPGSVTAVLDRLRSVDGIAETERVTGPHDVIARVRVGDVRKLDRITDLLKRLDGVLHVLVSRVVSAGDAVP
jgi:DNA-binding Lrp family transcriptional regulator